MAKFDNARISEQEVQARLIRNLADRPNAMNSYGRAKMSAEDLKKAFDDQFILVVNRHNLLHESVEGIRGEAQTERLEFLENRADTVDERLGDPNDANSIEDVIQRVADLESLLDDPENQETFQEDYKTLRTQVKSNATNTLANAGAIRENAEQIGYINTYLDHDPSDSANIFFDVYPIGSIYMSVNPTDPAYLFGGSWVALKDRFLVGAGGSYGVKAEGGEAVHTLTLEETPSHAHIQQATNNYDGWARKQVQAVGSTSGSAQDVKTVATNGTQYSAGTYASTVYTQQNGGGQPHNNIPPYYAVYMWRREA